jgi:PKD repeat protein
MSISNCKKDTPAAPFANFTFSGDNNPAPCEVTFSNFSTNSASYNWNFGDGTPASTEQNPQHTYTTGGTFNVILMAAGAGGSNSINKSVTIKYPIPGANFTFTGNSSTAPCTVTFSNASTNSTSFSWNFGDNSPTSTEQNPQHIYTAGGTYSVQLTAIGEGGSNSVTKSVIIQYPIPVADFLFSGNNSPAPCTVSFTNSSTNATTYDWNFGDGGTSTEANPQYTFAAGGVYNIQLTAISPGGNNSITKSVIIQYAIPTANFTFSGDDNPAPCTVTFTNYSSNATSYIWNFGDGGSSTATNPQHTYTTEGTYIVQLTATGPGGNNSITKSVIILDPVTGTDVTFNNSVYTNIYITLNGNTKTIYPGNSVTFYSVSGSSVSYYAYTSGETTTGSQIGLKLIWNYPIDLPGGSISFNLIFTDTYFFLYMTNEGTHNLTPLYVNYGLGEQTVDYILIPNDYVKYNIGYYYANINTVIRAYYHDSPDWYTYWQNINFPWTDNQSVSLVNTF